MKKVISSMLAFAMILTVPVPSARATSEAIAEDEISSTQYDVTIDNHLPEIFEEISDEESAEAIPLPAHSQDMDSVNNAKDSLQPETILSDSPSERDICPPDVDSAPQDVQEKTKPTTEDGEDLLEELSIEPNLSPETEIASEEDEQSVTVIASGALNETVNWTFYSDGLMEISGSGSMAVYSHTFTEWMDDIKSVVIGPGMSMTGESIFWGCSNLESVSLPASLEHIGGSAFQDCEKLTSIEVPDNVLVILGSAFCNCQSLEAIQLPDRLFALQGNTFRDCISLKALVIPDNVQWIGNDALSGCTALREVTVSRKVNRIDDRAFAGCHDLVITLRNAEQVVSVASAPNLFDGAENITINVPQSLYYAYLNDPYWGSYSNITFYGESSLPVDVTANGEHANVKMVGNASGESTSFFPGETVTVSANMEDKYEFVEWTSLDVEFDNATSTTTTFIMPDAPVSISWVSQVSCYVVGSGSFDDQTTWSIDTHGNLLIEGTGYLSLADGQEIPWAAWRDQITTVVISGQFTSVGAGLFSNHSSLQSVSLPDGMQWIGESAFSNCGNLATVSWPNGLWWIEANAFCGCSKLSVSELPNSVRLIKDSAFSGCPLGLSKLPDSLTSIGNDAFSHCSNLDLTFWPNGLESIGDRAFCGCQNITLDTIPQIYQLGEAAFYACTGLSNVRIEGTPSNAENYGELVFAHSNIKSVSFGPAATKIAKGMFSGCGALTSVTCEDGMTSIECDAFMNCGSLTSFTWSDRITSIGHNAFENCDNLAVDSLPTDLEILGEQAFSGCTKLTVTNLPAGLHEIPAECFLNCESITGIRISEGVTKIGTHAFVGNTSLTELMYVPGTQLREIEAEAFIGCPRLTVVNLPSSLESIGDRAFERCTSLERIVTPGHGNLLALGNSAFYGCNKLVSFDLPRKLRTIGNACFFGCSLLDIPNGLPPQVTHIGISAFRDCENLTLSTLPAGMTEVNEFSFSGCTKLRMNTLPNTITKINNCAFFDCNQLALAELPSSLKTIGHTAFGNCYNITIDNIPDGVTQVGQDAFYNCTSITTMELPETLEFPWYSSSQELFMGCTGLRKVILPSTVTILPIRMFAGCRDLTLELRSDTVVSLISGEDDPFLNATNITVHVPTSLFRDYCSDWSGKDVTIIAGFIGSRKVTFTDSAHAQNENGHKDTYFTPGEVITIVAGKTGILPQEYYEFIEWVSEDVEISDSHSVSASFVMPDKDITVTPIYLRIIAHGECGGSITWKLDENGILTLMGSGPMYSYTAQNAPWASQKNQIEQLLLDSRITTIGSYAFSGCTDLKSIGVLGGESDVLPSGLAEIGAYAFSDCNSFKLTSLPNGITHISDYAFQNCSVGPITIPETVVSIGEGAFYRSRIELPYGLCEGLATIGDLAFADCRVLELYSLPESVTAIGKNAFSNCDSIKLTALPSKLTRIEKRSFYYCPNLALTEIPDSVQFIGEYAFSDCPKLTIAQLPKSLTQIEDYAFYNSDGVVVNTLPSQLEYLGTNAFASPSDYIDDGLYRSRLNPWTLPSSLKYVGGYAFIGSTNLNLTELPDGITSIGQCAFSNCPNLNLCSLPSQLTTIGMSAFSGCPLLNIHELPAQATTIESEAFKNCTGLSSLTIPAGVSTLRADTFKGCSHLSKITLLRETGIVTIPGANDDPAFDYQQYEVYVPASLFNEYTTDANWASHILAQQVILYSQETSSIQIISDHGIVTASGNISGAGTEFRAGEVVTLTAQPEDGYQFVEWTSEGATIIPPTSAVTTFIMPLNAVTVTAIYKEMPKTIIAITMPNRIRVEYAKPVDQLDLPATVLVTLDDGSTQALPVTWDTSNYQSTAAEVSQILLGTLILPENIINPDGFEVAVEVIVKNKTTLHIVGFRDMPDLTVTYGTSANALTLPTQVTALCVEDGKGNESKTELLLPVAWNTVGYDPTTFGTYNLQGSLGAVPDDVGNPNDLQPTLKVTVAPIDSWEVGAESDGDVVAYLYEDPNQPSELILRVTGAGNMKDFATVNTVSWFAHREDITQVIIENGVTSIGNYTFALFAKLHTVHLGQGVTRIGSNAFGSCTELTQITIPANVSRIETSAFRACNQLTTIVFEHKTSDALYIEKAEGQLAFGAVRNIKTTVIGEHDAVQDLDFWAACGRIYIIPVASIVLDSTALTMPIGGTAQLIATLLPQNATDQTVLWSSSNGDVATISTTGLVTAVAPGVCTITATAEGGTLTATCTITVEEVWSVGNDITARLLLDESNPDGALYKLELTGSGSMQDFASAAKTPWYNHRAKISKVVVGDGITDIGEFAFNSLANLTEVSLPDGLVSIGMNSFNSCSSLTEITIPASVATIERSAFYGCRKLTHIVFRDTDGTLQLPESGGVFPGANTVTTVDIYCYNESVFNYPWQTVDKRNVTINQIEP